MNRLLFWKIFRLPTPFELGWADKHNALPMRDFGNRGDGPTWEDWEEKMEKEYPVRYFFSETFPRWFKRNIIERIRNTIYWLKCHLLSSHRYHIVDIRQPAKIEGQPNPDAYRWGWLDADHRMLYAIFNIFNTFVEEEYENRHVPSEEDIQAEPALIFSRNLYYEVKAIHYWWNVERLRQEDMKAKLLSAWSEARRNNAPETHQLWDDLHKFEKDFDDKTDEMLLRIMKIRRSLWT